MPVKPYAFKCYSLYSYSFICGLRALSFNHTPAKAPLKLLGLPMSVEAATVAHTALTQKGRTTCQPVPSSAACSAQGHACVMASRVF